MMGVWGLGVAGGGGLGRAGGSRRMGRGGLGFKTAVLQLQGGSWEVVQLVSAGQGQDILRRILRILSYSVQLSPKH